MDAEGNALAAWEADVYRQRDVGHIEAAYRPAGGVFGAPQTVSADGAAFPQVAMGSDGHGVVAWSRGSRVEAVGMEDGQIGEARVIGTSGTESHGPNAFEPGPPTLAVGPGGGANGIFSALRGAYAGRGHGFDGPVAVSPDQDGYVTQPALAFAPNGTLVAAWGWYLDGGHSGLQAASGRGGVLGPATTISDPVPLDWGIGLMQPHISVDGRGTPTAFWRLHAPPSYIATHLQTATGTASS